MNKITAWGLAVATTLVAVGPRANAQTDLTAWTFTPVDVPGAARTNVRGMNGAGQIVGHYTSGGVTRGFVLRDGVFTPIDLGGAGGFTSARGINSEGDIVGTFRVPPAATRGFLLRSGVMSEIVYPNAAYTQPDDINAAGDIVGYYLAGGVEHGFLLRNGVYSTVDVPGALLTNVRGINSEGEMVGIYEAMDLLDGKRRAHGFRLGKDGTVTTINGPSAPGGNANGINPRGEILGEYTASGIRYGFLLNGSEMISLSYPGAAITRPWKITPDGQYIVGFYNDLHGFVLSRKSLR